MGHFKLDMRPADYERRDPKRGNAATWFVLLVAGAIIMGATAVLLTGYDGEGIATLMNSLGIAR
jgi:hypothetical protein